MIRLLCAALILLGFPCRLIGQVSVALIVAPGDRIKIHRSGSPENKRETARFRASRGDTLIVQLETRPDTERVVGTIAAVVRGKQHRTGTGALAGLLIGAAGGAAGGYIWTGNCANAFGGTNGPSRTCAGDVATAMSILFGLTGLIVGTTVGAIATTDRWVDVDPRGFSQSRTSVHGLVTTDRNRELHLGLTVTR